MSFLPFRMKDDEVIAVDDIGAQEAYEQVRDLGVDEESAEEHVQLMIDDGAFDIPVQ